MSAELYDGATTSAEALPAVDILPAKPARKGRAPQAAEAADPAPAEAYPEQVQAPVPVQPAEVTPEQWAAAPTAPVNPWSGGPSIDFPPPTAAPIPAAAPLGAVSAVVPVDSVVPEQGTASEVPAEPAAPKKFFGMQVRRPKKVADPVDTADEPPYGPPPVPVPTGAAPAYDAVVAPVAAWPTDVGVAAVADAEPQQAAGGYAAPAQFAPIGLLSPGPADTVPAQPPVEAAAEAAVSPTAAPAPTPVPEAPVGPAADSVEVAALRAQIGVSESQRLAAENRADQAVLYAQQTQARLQQLESDGQARIQAAEAKARSAANEAQDWQIRHREAEATIAELAQSVASAEHRLSELRAERDELVAALEDATAPDHAPTS